METQNRPNATVIKILKEKIKGLSSTQRSLKLLRKTSLPQERRLALLIEAGMAEAWKNEDVPTISNLAWSTVESRRTAITACLNLYHEMRGSDFRHGVDEVSQYHYEKTLASIRKEIAG